MSKISMSPENPSIKEEIQIEQASKGPNPSVIRLRAFIIGLLIIPADNYWVLMAEKVRTGPYSTTISIFANVVFILTIIALINTLVRRILPFLALSMAEMLVIYTMVAIGAAIAGHDFLPGLVGMMVHPYKYATPENKWAETFMPYIPSQLMMSDKNALDAIYKGGADFLREGYWVYWLKPCLYWLLFITILIFVMMCINTLVRKQWTDRERLSYPTVYLPISMTEPKGALWHSNLFWIGFIIAFSIDLINGLAVYYPHIPTINVGTQNLLSNPQKPWNAMGWTPYSFYPFAIGLGFLLPADLSFSCWFFYWFWKAQLVLSSILALDSVPDFPYIRHQSFGGYVAILVMLTWTSRGYLKQVWKRIKGEPSELDDSGEPMSYRTAAAGTLIGFLLLCAFMRVWFGISPIIIAIAFLIYYILATAITRMRAELGPPVHDLHFSGPDYMITTCLGLKHLSREDMVGLSFLYWFNRAYRCHPMPIGIEGMKMISNARASQRKLLLAIMLAAIAGIAFGFFDYLHMSYKYGFAAKMNMGGAFAAEAYDNLANWWMMPDNLVSPKWGANLAMIGGFFFCIMLGFLRLNVANFPFHPIGYAISGSWSMNQVWAPLMLAWLFKITTLHFGGLNLYKKAVPLFLGLILGEMVMGSILSLIGLIWNIPYYNFWGA